MAVPTSPLPVLRFVGILARHEGDLAAARHKLVEAYGPIDDLSETIPFNFTEYYQKQMGPDLLRQWVRFSTLFSPEQLADCKLETNGIETLLAGEPKRKPPRPVNIDPGYVHRYKIILATTKDHSHRVYLRDGMYAEVTLHWSNNRWTPWPWTYADYQSATAAEFFNRARTAYMDQLQKIASTNERAAKPGGPS